MVVVFMVCVLRAGTVADPWGNDPWGNDGHGGVVMMARAVDRPRERGRVGDRGAAIARPETRKGRPTEWWTGPRSPCGSRP